MSDRLRAAAAEWEAALREVDAGSLVGRRGVDVVEVLLGVERRSAALRSRVAARVAEGDAWRKGGFRSPAEWLSRIAGTGFGQAKAALETAKRLAGQPEVRRAFEAGELSEDQTREIASAAERAPSTQGRLIRLAKRASLAELREECGRIRAGADPNPKATQERIHAGRHFRSGLGSEGAVRFGGRCTPDQYSTMKPSLEAECDRLFHQARAEGRREPREAYLMDALANLCARSTGSESAGGEATAPRRDLLIHLDLAALLRGRALSGELCEIEGIGPVPVEIAADLQANPFVKAVIRHGQDIRTVAHFGRHIPAVVRSALEARDRRCSVPGCDSDFRLEIDHNTIDHAQGGPAALWNLDRKCGHCHQRKTHQGYELRGPPGRRQWTTRDGHIVTEDPLFADTG